MASPIVVYSEVGHTKRILSQNPPGNTQSPPGVGAGPQMANDVAGKHKANRTINIDNIRFTVHLPSFKR